MAAYPPLSEWGSESHVLFDENGVVKVEFDKLKTNCG
jgi:hypothetical protein